MKRIALFLAVGALAIGLTACSSASAEQPAPTGTTSDAAVVVAAKDIRFDKAALTAPANVPFELEFDNHDGAPHNVAIKAADGGAVFSGEIFGGDATKVYQVPALAAGTYTFLCDVHPDMKGTLTVQ